MSKNFQRYLVEETRMIRNDRCSTKWECMMFPSCFFFIVVGSQFLECYVTSVLAETLPVGVHPSHRHLPRFCGRCGSICVYLRNSECCSHCATTSDDICCSLSYWKGRIRGANASQGGFRARGRSERRWRGLGGACYKMDTQGIDEGEKLTRQLRKNEVYVCWIPRLWLWGRSIWEGPSSVSKRFVLGLVTGRHILWLVDKCSTTKSKFQDQWFKSSDWCSSIQGSLRPSPYYSVRERKMS